MDLAATGSPTFLSSMAVAKRCSTSPNTPKWLLRTSTGVMDSLPIVSMPKLVKIRSVFLPIPGSLSTGKGARKERSPPLATSSSPSGLDKSEAKAISRGEGHTGVNAKLSGFIGGGSHHAPPVRSAANDYRLTSKLGLFHLLYGDKKGVKVNVDNSACHLSHPGNKDFYPALKDTPLKENAVLAL